VNVLPIDEDYGAEVAEMAGTRPRRRHAVHTIDSDTIVITRDGTVPAIFLSQRIDCGLLKSARRDWWKVANKPPKMRADAVGAPSLPEFKADGKTLSSFNSVPKPVLEVLERRGVGTCTLTWRKHHEFLVRHKKLIELINRLYRKYDHDRYSAQRAEVRKHPHSRFWHTAFNEGYAARRFATNYHTDRNLPGTMTALAVLGRHFTGGELVLPRWGLKFALRPGDLLLFDAEELHGNLRIRGKRLSAMLYCAPQ
jgi:hypothetical protein